MAILIFYCRGNSSSAPVALDSLRTGEEQGSELRLFPLSFLSPPSFFASDDIKRFPEMKEATTPSKQSGTKRRRMQVYLSV